MKKTICMAGLVFLGLNFGCLAYGFDDLTQNKLAYSASSLKYEINKKNRIIRSNEYKIKRISSSKNLSENEKRRQIYKLKSKNNNLKREVSRLKNSYRRAIS